MCDDLRSLMQSLEGKGVAYTTPVEAEWGISTSLRLPSGGEIGLYQPTHPTMIGAASELRQASFCSQIFAEALHFALRTWQKKTN